jgi:diadenosine tetraphosphatase ApaH/serine/threonine PP2A family protein phosphatase
MQTERLCLNPAIIRDGSWESDLKASSMSLIYAVGDIHGALHKLQNLVARCEEHADGRALTFVFVGDYIDRGPQSSGVIRFLIELQQRMPERVIALGGNHETTALSIIDGAPADHWLSQGGLATLRSYGIADVRELPREHVDWMRSLRLSHDDGRRFFVHAGVNPDRPLHAQDEYDLVWIREPFLSDERDYGRLVVHGHTPLREGAPDLRNNRLNLDTGAGFGGPLTAAVFAEDRTPPIAFLRVD